MLSFALLSFFAAESNLEIEPVYSTVESAVVADPEPLHEIANTGNKIIVSFGIKFFFIENRNRVNFFQNAEALKMFLRDIYSLSLKKKRGRG